MKKTILAAPLLDANLHSEIKINDKIGTANRFLDEIPDLTRRIDYIFTRNVHMQECKTVISKYKYHFPSDHLPIILKCEPGSLFDFL